MKARFLTLMLITLLSSAWAQPQPGPYAVVTLFKVDQGKAVTYEKLEKEMWKPIHQARKKAGDILGWYCYSVDFSGNGSEYNYVTVTVFDNLARLDNVNYANYFKSVFPNKSAEEMLKSTNESRILIRSELARMVAGASPDAPPAQMPPLRQLRFFKVDQDQQDKYLNMIKGVTAPVYKEIVKQGKMLGWQIWEMWLPTGESAVYDFVAVATYNSYGEASQGIGWSDTFKKVHPALNDQETGKTVQSMRKEIKNEVWRLVDWVN